MSKRIWTRYLRAFMCCAATLLLLLTSACKESKSADEYMKSARASRASGNIYAAIIDAKNALQQDPKNVIARESLAQFYLDLPDPTAAEGELLRAQQDGADRADIAKPLAQAQLLLGKPEAAIQTAEFSANSPELGASLLAIKAQAYMSLGRAAEARHALDAGLKLAPHSVDVLAAMSRYALAGGDTTAARQYLSDAQSQDPANPLLFDLAGAVAFATQDFSGSISAYQRMLDLAPWSLNAHLGLARSQIAEGKPHDADAHLSIVLKAAPNDVRANYFRALSAYRQSDYATAQSYSQRTLNAARNFPPALLLAGASSYALRQYEQAYAAVSQYVFQVPQDLSARKLLAAIQLSLGHSGDAVRTLSTSVDNNSTDAQLLAMIGAASARTGDFAAADRYLTRALEQQPGNTAIRTELGLAQLALGHTETAIETLEEASRRDPNALRPETALFIAYFRDKDYDKALELAERLKRSQPESATGFDFAGATYLAKSDETAAKAEFIKARERRPGDLVALRSLAELAIRAGDLAAATGYYGEILNANPKDSTAYLSLAVLLQQQGGANDVEALLQKGMQQNPGDPALGIVLGRTYVAERKYQQALDAIAPALAQNPREPALLEVAGQAQLALGNADGALGTFRTLADVLPDVSAAHRYLAEAYLAGKSPGSAVAEATKAVEADPKEPAAKLILARAYVANGGYDAAGKLLDELAADYPRAAALAELQGRVALARSRPADAISAFQRALSLNDIAPYRTQLALAQARAGQVEQAEKTLGEWLDNHPEDAASREALAEVYLSAKRFDDAQVQYQAVLSKTPNSATAENNLAWILWRNGDASGALEHARHAAALAPTEPMVLDTFGVVLLQNKQIGEAVETLGKAAGSAPTSPGIQFHFAQALADAGKKDQARGVLSTLLGTGRPFDDREQAQKLLQDLGS